MCCCCFSVACEEQEELVVRRTEDEVDKKENMVWEVDLTGWGKPKKKKKRPKSG